MQTYSEFVNNQRVSVPSVSDRQWLSWSASQRVAYMKEFLRPLPAENKQHYEQRVRNAAADRTAKAVVSLISLPRAAGQADNTAAILQAINQGLSGIENTATQFYNTANQTDRLRIQTAAQDQANQLQAQIASATGGARDALQTQLNQLQSFMTQIAHQQNNPPPSSGMSTGTMVALGVGGLAVVGLLIFAMRPRHNPTLYRSTPKGMRPYRYVRASRLK